MTDTGRKKTTRKDFRIFKDECQKWINFWGLVNWKVYYEHDYIEIPACIVYNLDAMIATITLTTMYDNDFYSIHNIRLNAFHEVCELMLAELMIYANERFDVDKRNLDKACHGIIRRLENKMFK